MANLPQIIFIDTNILLRLFSGNEDFNFVQLRKLVNILKIQLTITDLVLMELIQNQKESVFSEFEKLKSARKKIEKVANIKMPLIDDGASIEEKVRNYVSEQISNYGIKTVSVPKKFDISEMIKKAVEKIPPFEHKKEKGFKDAINLFGILCYCKENGIKNAMFITDDEVLYRNEIRADFIKNGINLVLFRTPSAADKELSSHVGKMISNMYERHEQKIKEYMNLHFDKVKKFIIENAEVSEEFLRYGGGPLVSLFSADRKKESFSGRLLQVTLVEPVEVNRVKTDTVFEKERYDLVKGGKITAEVKTRFNIMYVEYKGHGLLSTGKRVKLSTKEILEESAIDDPQVVEKKIEQDITIVATVSVEKKIIKGFQLEDVRSF